MIENRIIESSTFTVKIVNKNDKKMLTNKYQSYKINPIIK